jgi:hypothetical protein
MEVSVSELRKVAKFARIGDMQAALARIGTDALCPEVIRLERPAPVNRRPNCLREMKAAWLLFGSYLASINGRADHH